MISRLEVYLQRACLVILAYIPFHAFLSTWVISNFGGELLWKVLKDLVVCIITIGCMVLLYVTKPKLSGFEKKLAIGITLFILLCIVMFLVSDELKPAFAGLIISIRFFLFFASMLILGRISNNPDKFMATTIRIVFIGFAIVVMFGLLQITVLPVDFLRRFGYSTDLIPPYFTVDNNQSFIRILSTLRGPNPLGAYLAALAPIAFVVYLTQRKKKAGYLKYWLIFALSYLAVVYQTYSRSAFIGLVVSLVVFLTLQLPAWRKKIAIGLVAFAVITTGAMMIFQNTIFMQRIVFHSDPLESSNINSDDQHLGSLRNGINDVFNHPGGHGIGTAGLASTYGKEPMIIENYFIETSYQFGLIGLLLNVFVYGAVATLLWRLKSRPLAAALFASFIGLVVVNLFWPAWTDETVSLVWWGLAGAVIGVYNLGKLPKRVTVSSNGKAKAKK